MVNTRGVAHIVSLDWITTDTVRVGFDYHAYSNPDVSISSYIDTDHTLSSLSLKSDMRSVIISEYTNRSLSWNTLLDDFVLLGGVL